MRINFVGDVCLHEINTDAFDMGPRIRDLFDAGTLNTANLESPLTTSTEKAPHHPRYKRAAPMAGLPLRKE